ncbi:CocE/NonD family hydrolase [Metabacillus bambusae]|uniref:CocE/NonD family hydrolase n=1 Tax=Metabacillus bambusae TaxID=2795218 RepID=A0ABS3N7A9_9BACI|nr:CocE/NonD family hydrolase [Metabacillus bambusae]MBO1514048.1 CocE/NonD family hydrolase [Metabacillus bambusae]
MGGIGERVQFHLAMRDGVRLSTYVQFPSGNGPWPVVFSRSPYPGMLKIWLERAELWAEYGYIFIFQECRGTGQSEGEWEPFVNERHDGLDTLDWIVKQTWMNGNIATYGASYSGVLQWCLADEPPPEVKTMFISVTGIERYRQNYMNGMFRHDIYTLWAIGNAGKEPILQNKNLYQEALKVKPHIDMDVKLFGEKLPWYREWVSQVEPTEPYWSKGFWSEVRDIPRKVNIPIMMIAGWFDHNLDASIQSYKKLPEQTKERSAFIIGPWIHTEDVAGDLEYPNHDIFGPQQFKAALDWFDHHLKGKKYDGKKGTVQTYIIREGSWNTRKGWLQSTDSISYYLEVTDTSNGELSLQKSEANRNTIFHYNPNDPVPTKGGAALLAYLSGDPDTSPPASVVQRVIGERSDVISFVSDPFSKDTRIAGEIKANLYVSSDAEDTSFTVTIMEVFPNGTSYNIRDGIASLRYRKNDSKPYDYRINEVVNVEIEMWTITWTIKEGSRIRVDVSSSNFPAYHAHPNVSSSWALQKKMKIAKQTIYTGGAYGSKIVIPIVSR